MLDKKKLMLFGSLAVVVVALVVAFIVWMLKGFVDSIPADLEESAMVEGCSRTGAFFRVTFPLLGPGLVATGVFGARMQVSSVNDGPITLVLESPRGRVARLTAPEGR